MPEWSTVAEIGGGPMVIVLDGGEVEIELEPGVVPEDDGTEYPARRLDTQAKVMVEGNTVARPMKGCLGCACGECD